MGIDDMETAASILDHLVVSLAALIGGIWVVFRLYVERTDEAALKMEMMTILLVVGGLNLVIFTGNFTNKGRTRQLRPKPRKLRLYHYETLRRR